jgi:hypothetical protein
MEMPLPLLVRFQRLEHRQQCSVKAFHLTIPLQVIRVVLEDATPHRR